MVVWELISSMCTDSKGVRAQKIGLKSTYLKYDLSKSLRKEMWCKMADTKTYFDNIF